MEYIHTVKKYTVFLTTEEIIECDNLKVLYDAVRRRIRWGDENSPHISTKILIGGLVALKNRHLSSRWERSNSFPIFFLEFYLDVLRFLKFYLDVPRLNRTKKSSCNFLLDVISYSQKGKGKSQKPERKKYEVYNQSPNQCPHYPEY